MRVQKRDSAYRSMDPLSRPGRSCRNRCESFLNWLLDNEIGANIEDLKNRTKLQRYYQLEFKSFHKILKDNKNVLKDGYDPGLHDASYHLVIIFPPSSNLRVQNIGSQFHKASIHLDLFNGE
jgi:hypothetical protein